MQGACVQSSVVLTAAPSTACTSCSSQRRVFLQQQLSRSPRWRTACLIPAGPAVTRGGCSGGCIGRPHLSVGSRRVWMLRLSDTKISAWRCGTAAARQAQSGHRAWAAELRRGREGSARELWWGRDVLGREKPRCPELPLFPCSVSEVNTPQPGPHARGPSGPVGMAVALVSL